MRVNQLVNIGLFRIFMSWYD